MKIKISELKKLIKESVYKNLAEQLSKDISLDPVGKTEKGKKVNVGQIRDIDNDGDIDSSDAYLAHRRKKITQDIKNDKDLHEDHDEEKTTIALSWGTIPSVEQLAELMGDEPFTMDLKGADSLAWEYSMKCAEDPLAGQIESAKGLHTSLEALMETQNPQLLSDEKYSEVEDILDQWYERYPEEEIEDTAYDLASSILNVLGVEWI